MPSPTCIRILIADDHEMVRQGLKLLLERFKDMEVVAEAANGQEAVELYRQHQPDIVLMDIVMPGIDGIEATRTIRAKFSAARIIILSAFMREEEVYLALKSGAAGYIIKPNSSQVLYEAVRAVYAGQSFVSREVGIKLAEHSQYQPLTHKEHVVLQKIVEGYSNHEIADALFITEGTVKSHVNKILEKLHVTDRTQAAVKALDRGIIKRN